MPANSSGVGAAANGPAPEGIQTPDGFAAGTYFERNAAANTLPTSFESQQWGAGRGGMDYWSEFLRNGMNGQPVNVAYDTTNQDQSRTWQNTFMQDLQRQAAGDLNSRAQQSLQQGYQQAQQGQMALGSAMRGTGGAAGLRAGARGAGDIQRGFAGDQQMLLAQEQQGAQAALAQMLAQQRAQDQQQSAGMAQNELGNRATQDEMAQFYAAQGLDAGVNAEQVDFDFLRMMLGMGLEANDIGLQNTQRAMGAAATGLGAFSSSWGSGGNNNGGGGGYRQVDGQNSIVPDWDK